MRRECRFVLRVLLTLAALVALLSSIGQPATAVSMLDLAVLIYKEWGIAAPGQEVKHDVHFINQGGYLANDVRIVFTLPGSTTYVTSSQPGFVLIRGGPDQVVLVRDRLSVFERGWLSLTLRVNYDAPAGRWLDGAAYILCLDPESNYDNNDYFFAERILPTEPDLTVRTELQSGASEPGNTLLYHIHFRNQGGSEAHSIRITDTLPTGVTYVADSNSIALTTVQTGTAVVWEKSSVPADSYGDMYVTVNVSDEFDASSDWLDTLASTSTSDTKANYDSNWNRHVWKPQPGNYGAAVASVDDKTMQLLNEGGFDWMVYYLDWSDTEPQDGQYYWRDLDSAIWQAWWYHKKLAVRVDRALAWGRGSGSATAPPSNPDKLREFLKVVAEGQRNINGPTKLVPRIDAFVIWNEPNLASEWGGNAPDAAAYTNLLQAAWTGIKAGDPNALVVSAGLAPTGDDPPHSVGDFTFLEQMLANGACDYFDHLGVNPLGFASPPDDDSGLGGYNFQRSLEWRDILDDYCEKPMFATEMGRLRESETDLGSYDWMKVLLMDPAHYLARAYHKARREWSWMGPMSTWNLDFSAFYPDTDQMRWFSVTDGDRLPLRPYLTLKNAATRGPADISVEIELVSPAVPGDNLDYLIHFTNIGGQPAQGVVMTGTLPDGTSYVSDGRGNASLLDGQVVWDIETVDTGAHNEISLSQPTAWFGVLPIQSRPGRARSW